MDPQKIYSMTEIVEATGINLKTASYRARTLGYQLSKGIPYEGVVKILSYQKKTKRKCRPAAVNELRLALKNDGFKIKEK